MKPPEIVMSIYDQDVRFINKEEGRIVASEEDADGGLWAQAGKVVALLEAGMSQRELARQWINGRTGEAYSRRHIQIVLEVASLIATKPRPRFRDVYNEIANKGSGAHVGKNTGENEWYSPEEYVEAAREVMGAVDLDPASTSEANTVIKAAKFYTEKEDGLIKPWAGRVWMNPPYAQPLIGEFAEKLAASFESREINQACALVNNATETKWFQRIAGTARAICFPAGRVRFWHPERESATPLQGQAIIYLGDRGAEFAERFESFGLVVRIVL